VTMQRAMTDEAKELRREAILTAAKHVFADRGYHATTMADVARAAELSYGTLYWYFESKDALFHALMDQEEQALRDHVAGAGDDFRLAVRSTFEFFEADRRAVKLLFRDAPALGDRFERHLGGIHERFIGDIEATVRAAQARGLVVDHPPRLVAFSIAALIGQLALRRLATDDGLPAEALADLVVSLVLDGLRPR
jgi:AcrR family transcriptional regulator